MIESEICCVIIFVFFIEEYIFYGFFFLLNKKVDRWKFVVFPFPSLTIHLSFVVCFGTVNGCMV